MQAQPPGLCVLPGENFYTVQEGLQRGGKGTHRSNLLPSCCPSVHLRGLSLQFLQVTGNQCFQDHQHLEAGKITILGLFYFVIPKLTLGRGLGFYLKTLDLSVGV